MLIDEAQFLKKHHILELTQVVDELNIPVMAGGWNEKYQRDYLNRVLVWVEHCLKRLDSSKDQTAVSV